MYKRGQPLNAVAASLNGQRPVLQSPSVTGFFTITQPVTVSPGGVECQLVWKQQDGWEVSDKAFLVRPDCETHTEGFIGEPPPIRTL